MSPQLGPNTSRSQKAEVRPRAQRARLVTGGGGSALLNEALASHHQEAHRPLTDTLDADDMPVAHAIAVAANARANANAAAKTTAALPAGTLARNSHHVAFADDTKVAPNLLNNMYYI